MKYFSHLLELFKAVTCFSFSVLGEAEIRMYDWDGVFPLKHRHGWCDLWGTPYSVLFNNGLGIVEGGWVDVRHLSRIKMDIKVTGSDAGTIGSVDLQLQATFDYYKEDLLETPSQLSGNAPVSGNTPEVSNIVDLDVASYNYIRVYSVFNNCVDAVTVRVTTGDYVRPAIG